MLFNSIELVEIVEAVDAVEQDIFESTEGVEYFNITVVTNGSVLQVKFLDIILWSTEDDDRIHIEESDTYEPFEK